MLVLQDVLMAVAVEDFKENRWRCIIKEFDEHLYFLCEFYVKMVQMTRKGI